MLNLKYRSQHCSKIKRVVMEAMFQISLKEKRSQVL